eukprot:TRINITY_DN8557_c0_g1_i1.p1 TRINITY_DN8557_c0_g1~~TRINITY_DN8557_c0_g1_i1.p1  ORF type:complete len:356 (-),score=46.34 TRINITY_DN8557_c0_g1_i1:23-1090(-)
MSSGSNKSGSSRLSSKRSRDEQREPMLDHDERRSNRSDRGTKGLCMCGFLANDVEPLPRTSRTFMLLQFMAICVVIYAIGWSSLFIFTLTQLFTTRLPLIIASVLMTLLIFIPFMSSILFIPFSWGCLNRRFSPPVILLLVWVTGPLTFLSVVAVSGVYSTYIAQQSVLAQSAINIPVSSVGSYRDRLLVSFVDAMVYTNITFPIRPNNSTQLCLSPLVSIDTNTSQGQFPVPAFVGCESQCGLCLSNWNQAINQGSIYSEQYAADHNSVNWVGTFEMSIFDICNRDNISFDCTFQNSPIIFWENSLGQLQEAMREEWQGMVYGCIVLMVVWFIASSILMCWYHFRKTVKQQQIN